MAERVRLTDERIRRFVCPEGKSQAFLWDDDPKRLAVRVTSSGIKAFIFEDKLNDRSTIRWTIGKTDGWTLEDARKEARRLQTLVDKGIDPRELEREQNAKKAEKKAAEEANRKYTLKALLEAYADYLEARGKVKSAKAARSASKVHVFERDPTLSAKAANIVSPDEISSLIRKTRESGKERTAGILRSTLKTAYNCGRRAAFDPQLPAFLIDFKIVNNPVDAIPAIAVKAGNRTLSRDELKNYMAALNEDIIDMALKLALFSGGQRMAQVLRAEINDWNADDKILRLLDPKGKRTQAREHFLPLGPVAVRIVETLVMQAEAKKTKYLFPSNRWTYSKAEKHKHEEDRTIKTHIHESMPGPRVTEISKAMGGESFDLRDIRRTCETMLASLGVSRDIRAQLLSHGISGVQAQHYDRYEYLKEKHAALIKWERHLNRITSGDEEKKVINLSDVRGR